MAKICENFRIPLGGGGSFLVGHSGGLLTVEDNRV